MFPEKMLDRARHIASLIAESDDILIVTHIDADGITAGSIAKMTLERLGKNCDVCFVKQLGENEINSIADESRFTWFTDLGSGQLDLIKKNILYFVVSDHHVPICDDPRQLNPHTFGYDGGYELSGGTTTYLISKMLGRSLFAKNVDLAALSIVGAVGDLQDSREGRLVGLNRTVLEDGLNSGTLDVKKDLRLFGKQTRPVAKMLEYTFDPFLPGLSGNEKASLEFLESLGIKVGDWGRWVDLSTEERRNVTSALVKLCMNSKLPYEAIKKLVGESYILLNEEEGTELRDAMEFSTLLNATARYGYHEIGLRICLGDRNSAFKKARTLLQNHRRNLSEGLKLVDELGIIEMENIQYFDAGEMILDTIVGIVAGMCYSKANLNKPIVGLVRNEDGIKVSARATQRLVDRGVHLAKAIKEVAKRIGGEGGGHSIAAGALIPESEAESFLRELDRIVGMQIGRIKS
jgi:RecJ-like exonuclease